MKMSPKCGSDYGLESDQGCPLAREAAGQFPIKVRELTEKEKNTGQVGALPRERVQTVPKVTVKGDPGAAVPRDSGGQVRRRRRLPAGDSGWDGGGLFPAVYTGSDWMTSPAVVRHGHVASCW